MQASFVLSSINERCPIVIFEALGVGLLVVASNVGRIPEIIKSDEFGYLYPPKNAECLEQRILNGLSITWIEKEFSICS